MDKSAVDSIQSLIRTINTLCSPRSSPKMATSPTGPYVLLRVTGSSLEPSRPCWRRSHFRRATRRAEGTASVSFLKIVSLV